MNLNLIMNVSYKKVRSKLKSVGLINLIYLCLKYPLYRVKRRLKWYFILNKDTDKVFTTIFKKNIWSSSESKSGSGSEKHYTENLRSWLIENIPKYKIRTIVDSPCGDFNWMRYVLPHVSVNYLGCDIVDELVKINIDKYSSKNITFKKLNIIEETIPDCDLLIVRDCLFHFSYQDINRFLENIKTTNYKYLLTTSHIVNQDFKNSNIKTGEFRIINLLIPPFNFNENNILDIVKDYPEGHKRPKNMLLIKKEFIPKNISFPTTQEH